MDNEPQAETQEASAYLETPAMASARRRWTRGEVAERLADLDRAVGAGESERSFAERSGTPRSTLRRWDQRRDDLGVEPSVAAFFESPAGVAFLHRLVVALVFVLCLRSPSGIRLICEFLELSGLAGVVAPSFSSVRRMAIRMEEEILAFGASQRQELAQRMEPKRITLAEDETYHPDICLVATEPVSNFIVVEEYVEHRDAGTCGTKPRRRRSRGSASRSSRPLLTKQKGCEPMRPTWVRIIRRTYSMSSTR